MWTDSANMKTNRSLLEALRGFDVVLAVIRSRPELELALYRGRRRAHSPRWSNRVPDRR